VPGFSNADDAGKWTDLDVDLCRAVAAAVLGDPSKVKFTPLTAKERLTALQSGEIDLLSRNTTWSLTGDSALGLHFAGVNYYDGQGFLINKSLGIKSAKELDGRPSVCFPAPPRSSTWPITSAPAGWSTGRSFATRVILRLGPSRPLTPLACGLGSPCAWSSLPKGDAGYRSPAHQPILEFDEELVPGHRHRLSGSSLGVRRYHVEPDGPGGGGDRYDHGGLSR